MANISEPSTPVWSPNVTQFDVGSPIQGGADGIDNLPHKELAARTQWLRKQITDIYPVISFGAAGNGVTNDRAALQACIDWAADQVKNHGASNIAIDLLGRSYLVNGDIHFGGANDGYYGITLRDGKIIAQSDVAWAGGPVVAVGGSYGTGPTGALLFERVTVECNHVASGFDLACRGGGVVTLNGCSVVGAKNYGVAMDNCAFCYVNNSMLQEWNTTEAGFSTPANYTSKAVWFKSAAQSCSVTNSLLRYNDYAVYNEGPNNRISGNDIDQSGNTIFTRTNPKGVYSSAAAAEFSGNQFFLGDITLHGPNGLASIWTGNRFLHTPLGVTSYGNNNRVFNLVATTSGQTVGRFKEITENNWVTDQIAANAGSYPTGIIKYHYTTSGGTWAGSPGP